MNILTCTHQQVFLTFLCISFCMHSPAYFKGIDITIASFAFSSVDRSFFPANFISTKPYHVAMFNFLCFTFYTNIIHKPADLIFDSCANTLSWSSILFCHLYTTNNALIPHFVLLPYNPFFLLECFHHLSTQLISYFSLNNVTTYMHTYIQYYTGSKYLCSQ
uniref:Uncharacterized protein n=1 Tax=Octopus bimaculoides TaxID=37653 RepID=A0A0L8HYV0_OCTBM